MRTPSTPDSMLAWWRAALKARQEIQAQNDRIFGGRKKTRWTHLPGAPKIHDGDPHCGYYAARFNKSGGDTPVFIFIADQAICRETGELEEDERFSALAANEPVCPYKIWTWCAKKPISAEEYDYLVSICNREPVKQWMREA